MTRTARAWAVVVALAGAWAAAGPWLAHRAAVVAWLLKAGAVSALAAEALFIVVYTVLGWRGPSKWWRDPIGMTLVLFAAAAASTSAVLVAAFIFGHVSAALTWAFTGGLIGGSLVVLWRTWLWIQIARAAGEAPGNDDAGET